MGEVGEDAADEFFEAGFCGVGFGFALAEGVFPDGGKAGCLFAHGADGDFIDVEKALFGGAGFVLEGGDVGAEGFVLAAEGFEVGLEGLGAAGGDGEVGVEVALEVLDFGLEALEFALEGAAGGESGFPEEGGDHEAEEEAPREWVFESFGEEFHGRFYFRAAVRASAVRMRGGSGDVDIGSGGRWWMGCRGVSGWILDC